jgi:hypothetical protein
VNKLRFIERQGPIERPTIRVLQYYGEIEQAPNSTDGEGNPIYDGPTIEGWQDVPLVTTSSAVTGEK